MQIMDAAHVRVCDALRVADLLLEATRRPRPVGDAAQDGLQRHLPVHQLIVGLVHLAHAAATDEALDSIARVDERADRERGAEPSYIYLFVVAAARSVVDGITTF